MGRADGGRDPGVPADPVDTADPVVPRVPLALASLFAHSGALRVDLAEGGGSGAGPLDRYPWIDAFFWASNSKRGTTCLEPD